MISTLQEIFKEFSTIWMMIILGNVLFSLILLWIITLLSKGLNAMLDALKILNDEVKEIKKRNK